MNSDKISVRAFPNPTNSYFTLSFSSIQKSAQFILIDVVGNIVFEKTINNQNKIDVACNGFSKGIYMYRVLGEDGISHSGKIIIE
ncbi:MAG: T9SS type A sorting domain-containing protein [Chitinophagales bacterium]|nr:T9SS type A sorting domain-containing protein [Chitinophagales bacterium]